MALKIKAKKPNYAERIRSLRTKLGLSQRDLAKEFGVSPGAVAHWESGEREVSGPVRKLIEIFEAKAKEESRKSQQGASS